MNFKQVPTPQVPEAVQYNETPTNEEIAAKLVADGLVKAGEKAQALGQYKQLLAVLPVCEIRARVLHNAALCADSEQEQEQHLREAIDVDPRYRKARLRLARLFAAQGNWLAAQIEFTHVQAISELSEGEKREKEEADEAALAGTMDVLKGWGNKILNKFGMSTDDFKTVKNPDGTMSIECEKK